MVPSQLGSDYRVKFTGEFADPATEATFRGLHAPQDQFFARVIVAAAAVAVVGFAAVDSQFFSGPTLAFVWIVRLVFVFLSLLALGALWSPLGPRAFEWVFGGWNLTAVILHVYIASVWPPGHSEMRMTTTLTALMCYCVMPLPLRLQLGIAMLHSVGAFVASGWLSPPDDDMLPVSYACWLWLLNVLGVFLSFRLHARQRMLFAALLRETELVSKLERALGEVKTLRGMIRVCAWCRKVDTGADWQLLEAYVREHSHAEFTHGICPVCLNSASGEGLIG